MGSTQVAHALNSSALSETQSSALARIYTRALERYYESKKAAEPAPDPDNSNDRRNGEKRKGGESCKAAPR